MPTSLSIVYSTQITHIGSGTSLAANAMSPSSDVSTALSSTNLARYPLADLALFISNTGSVSSNSNTILVYRRDLNIDGTNDEPVPSTATSAAYRPHMVGVITIPPFSVASTSYHSIEVPLSDQCEFYIENKLNTAIAVGWTLKVTPKTDSFA